MRTGNPAAVLQDLRHALRLYRAKPGFAAAALLALTVGIGGCGLILALAQVLLFRPVPYPQPERLVFVTEQNLAKGFPHMSSSPADFGDYRRQAPAFERLAAFRRTAFTLETGEPERVKAALVSGELFDLLGMAPELGTAVAPRHDRPEEKQVVVLGHALWERRFGGDPGIVGRPIQLDGQPYTVLGVMPASFRFPQEAELWAPLGLGAQMAADADNHYLSLAGRLRPGATLAQAQRELDLLSARREQRSPRYAGWRTIVQSLPAEVAAPLRPALLVLLAGGGLLLLIACGNVANLLLALAAGRGREIATRAALGASAGRLVRQILTESTLLTLAGGLLGLAAAALGSRALVHLLPDLAPRWPEVGVDLPVAAATLGLALASGLLSGLAPALRLARADLRTSLHEGAAGASLGWRRNRAAALLAVAQLALSFVLLVGAGLLVRSFWLLTHVDPGFAPAGVLTLRVELPKSQYPGGRERAAFFDAALERLRALPGVESAGASSTLPLSGSFNLTGIAVPGREKSDQDLASFSSVTPGYLETVGIRLAAGRTLAQGDGSAVVISRSLARRYFPGVDPLGRILRLGFRKDVRENRVVGVVEDVRARGLDSEGEPAAYNLASPAPPSGMTFCLRTRLDPRALAPAARRAILAVDPRQPVDAVAPLEQVVRDSVADHQLALFALSGFAALALVLAAVGIYGLLSHLVARATREIGLRVALGAERRHLAGLVSAVAAWVLVPGLALGAVLAYAASRLLASQLFGISRADAPTYLGAVALLTLLALAACCAPALRAARVDPRAALAEE